MSKRVTESLDDGDGANEVLGVPSASTSISEPDAPDASCTAFQGRLGFTGQAFAVVCLNQAEHWILLGWTNHPDGGAWVQCVEAHPLWHGLKTITLSMEGRAASDEQLHADTHSLPGHVSFSHLALTGRAG